MPFGPARRSDLDLLARRLFIDRSLVSDDEQVRDPEDADEAEASHGDPLFGDSAEIVRSDRRGQGDSGDGEPPPEAESAGESMATRPVSLLTADLDDDHHNCLEAAVTGAREHHEVVFMHDRRAADDGNANQAGHALIRDPASGRVWDPNQGTPPANPQAWPYRSADAWAMAQAPGRQGGAAYVEEAAVPAKQVKAVLAEKPRDRAAAIERQNNPELQRVANRAYADDPPTAATDDPKAIATAQVSRLDDEARLGGASPTERTLRGIDAAAAHLENGKPEVAAALYDAEATRIRAQLPNLSGGDKLTHEMLADEFDRRADLYRATDTASARRAAGRLAVAARQTEFIAKTMTEEYPEHAKVMRVVAGDSQLQASGVHASAVKADAELGKGFSTVYRGIVNKAFDDEIENYGGIRNRITGGRDELEADKKKMNEAFDYLDQIIEREGVPFHEAWRTMFRDNHIPKDRGTLPSFGTPNQAAAFIRDHELSRGLLIPMSKVSEGIWEKDADKTDLGRADLVQALRDNKQWGTAKAVLDDFKSTAATAAGQQEADRLSDNEWRERWTSHGADFVSEELPVLVLSGVVSGGAGTLARAGAVAWNVGSKGRTAMVVGAELGTFVVSERVLNDALNGKRADWSGGAIGRDLAFGAAGYGVFKAAGAGWRAFRAKAPELGRFGSLWRGPSAASKATMEAAEQTAGRLRTAVAGGLRQPGVRPRHTNKLSDEASRLLDEIEQAQALLRRSPNGPARARLERALAEAQPAVQRLQAYTRLPRPAAGDDAARAAFQAEEASLRTALNQDLRAASENLYKIQAELGGVRIASLGQEAGAPFTKDPLAVARAHRARHGLDPARNVGYGELTVGGRPLSLGPAASGRGPGALANRSGEYVPESRILQANKGHHGHRSNDSEIQLLEAARTALAGNRNASGTLRIFTERPPCASCRRVMARFLAEHPNVTLEVFHNARHIPTIVGIGAGVETGRAVEDK